MTSILLQVDLPPSNLPFLFAAFAVTWLLFFAYAYFVARRREELQREIRSMQQELDQRTGPSDEDQSAS